MAIIKHMSGVHFFWPQKEVNLRMIMDGYGVSNGVHSTMGPGYGVSFASCTKKMMNSSSPQLSVVVSQLLCFLSLIGLLTSSSEGSQTLLNNPPPPLRSGSQQEDSKTAPCPAQSKVLTSPRALPAQRNPRLDRYAPRGLPPGHSGGSGHPPRARRRVAHPPHCSWPHSGSCC